MPPRGSTASKVTFVFAAVTFILPVGAAALLIFRPFSIPMWGKTLFTIGKTVISLNAVAIGGGGTLTSLALIVFAFRLRQGT